ncbi:hypothetical protein SSUST3_0846 [Streptococcus suis ST3]|nr:hypothetical protein SSUST3_0846 [Streptococcus suis ST3]AGW87209.1 hypothetical protein YB51_4185 [Streptococcus suis YB51]
MDKLVIWFLILLWVSPVIIVALAGGFIIFSLLFGRRK